MESREGEKCSQETKQNGAVPHEDLKIGILYRNALKKRQLDSTKHSGERQEVYQSKKQQHRRDNLMQQGHGCRSSHKKPTPPQMPKFTLCENGFASGSSTSTWRLHVELANMLINSDIYTDFYRRFRKNQAAAAALTACKRSGRKIRKKAVKPFLSCSPLVIDMHHRHQLGTPSQWLAS